MKCHIRPIRFESLLPIRFERKRPIRRSLSYNAQVHMHRKFFCSNKQHSVMWVFYNDAKPGKHKEAH